jgi:DNA-binding transcriptional ArsR family regulator
LPGHRPKKLLTGPGQDDIFRYLAKHKECSVRELMAVAKALADESRVRILMALEPGELCVCQIVELLQLAPSTVSKHMSILKQARLLESRKEGRWMFYRLSDEEGPTEAKEMAALVFRLTAADARRREDAKRLKQILKMDRDELCRKQSQCRCRC